MNLVAASIIAHACSTRLKLKLNKLIIIPPIYIKRKKSNSMLGQLEAAQLNELREIFKTKADIMQDHLRVWFPSVHHGVQFKPFEFPASSCMKPKI
jgi:hypothetical protein